MTEKVTGYSLLGIGIFLIVISAISVFQVFTGGTKPVRLFQMQGISLDLGSSLGLPSEVTRGLQTTTKPQEIIPAEMINDSANLFAHIILMGFIAATGQKLASLGIQLVRPIVVKLNETKA